MPELPDLQIFARNLEKRFKNKTLKSLQLLVTKKANASEQEIQDALEGHQLANVSREGKTIQLHFKNKQVLGLHLMLHGELKFLEASEEMRFQIITLQFTNGGFTLADFQKQATPTLNPEPSDVPDALSADFSLQYLQELLGRKKTTIKSVLMDQQMVRGIGNTYADEILWAARISPFSVAKAIPQKAVETLHQKIQKVLKEEIKAIGNVMKDEVTGEVKEFLRIHDPDKKESPTGKEIVMQKVGGRKTYFTAEQIMYE
jgi:formamidopyrimidine-DNA glycosylase